MGNYIAIRAGDFNTPELKGKVDALKRNLRTIVENDETKSVFRTIKAFDF